MDIGQIRSAVRNGRGPDGYPPKLRAAAAAYAAQQREQGRRWVDIEADVGISSTSLRAWMRAAKTSGFAELQVVDPGPRQPPSTEIVLTSPNGFTVTGAALEDVARLLMAVG